MKKNIFFLAFLVFFLSVSCGESSETRDIEVYEPDDKVAFRALDSENLFQMDFEDTNETMDLTYSNISPLPSIKTSQLKWEKQQQALNTVCSKGSPKITSMDKDGRPKFESPIYVVSPRGAYLGLAKDVWEPAWSPDGEKVVFACGPDQNGDVWVVSNHEYSDATDLLSEDLWSRDYFGSLSSQMEIFVSDLDGSFVTQLTRNNHGDWLPRWFPSNNFDAESTLGQVIGEQQPILIESNRNGKSDVFILSTIDTFAWNLSLDLSKGQSPAWSENGSLATFSGGEENESKIFLVNEVAANTYVRGIFETDQEGIPIPWVEQIID